MTMFKDVKWDSWGLLDGPQNEPVYDSRSTSATTVLFNIVSKPFTPNILRKVRRFKGRVVHGQMETPAESKFYLGKQTEGKTPQTTEWVYKVWMPTTSGCLGRPKKMGLTKRSETYRDVHVSNTAVGITGEKGDLVRIPNDSEVVIEFNDLGGYEFPMIVEVIGQSPITPEMQAAAPAQGSRNQYRGGGGGGGCGPAATALSGPPATAKERDNVIFSTLLPGAQVITPEQEIISSPAFPTSLTSTVQRELTYWKGKKECDSDETKARLNVYWRGIGIDGTGKCTAWAWSAAYISYVIMKSDPSFGGSRAHTGYAKNAKKGVGGWTLWQPQPGIKAQIGDILMYPNQSPGAAAWASHGDVVYAVEGSKAYLAGGNLSDTSKGGRPGDSKETGFNYLTLNLDSNGYYSDLHAYKNNYYRVILKKNGKVQNRTTGEVATATPPRTPPSCGAGPDGSPSAPSPSESSGPSGGTPTGV